MLLALVVGCEEQAPTVVEVSREETAGTLGFMVSAGTSYYGDFSLSIVCGKLVRPRPRVTFGDSLLSTDGWWALGYPDVRPGSNVSYQIAWQSDVLADSFTIPHAVDSIFCNGHRLSLHSSDTVRSRDTIPMDSAYRFRWHCQGAPYYSVGVKYELADTFMGGRLHAFQSCDSLTIAAVQDSEQIGYVSVAVTTCLDSISDLGSGVPGARSGRLYAYRSISGGSRSVNVQLLAH